MSRPSAVALRSRKWRAAHPGQSRANNASYRARHPLTPEQRAHKAEVNRAWRAKNAAQLKRYAARRWLERGDAIKAKRRAKYALNPQAEQARLAAWKAAHPDHNRAFYRRHREKFTGDGQWSKRTQARRRAWRKFTQTCAASRAITLEIAP